MSPCLRRTQRPSFRSMAGIRSTGGPSVQRRISTGRPPAERKTADHALGAILGQLLGRDERKSPPNRSDEILVHRPLFLVVVAGPQDGAVRSDQFHLEANRGRVSAQFTADPLLVHQHSSKERCISRQSLRDLLGPLFRRELPRRGPERFQRAGRLVRREKPYSLPKFEPPIHNLRDLPGRLRGNRGGRLVQLFSRLGGGK